MEAKSQKAVLTELLDTYKRNRERVPLKELKTKYKAGYEELCKKICIATSEYVKEIIFHDIRIHKDYMEEAAAIMNKTICDSGILTEFSHTIFTDMDLNLLEEQAINLLEIILADLEPFFSQHIGLYITLDCLQEPYNPPTFYNNVTGLFFDGNKWVRKEHQNAGILLFLKEKQERTAS